MKFYSLTQTVSKKKGYTLLFSVVVSSLVLAVAAFILSISRKQFILASASRDSTVAIYAADSGLECAVENLTILSTSSVSAGGNVAILGNCGWTGSGGNGWRVSILNNTLNSDGSGTTTFYMPAAASASSGGPCTWVQVGQWYGVSGNQITSVESRGYNLGWHPVGNGSTGFGTCDITGPRKVERALRLRYE
jgi:hypothetical protein